MLDISYASDIKSAIMAELAGVDVIWTVAREVFETASRSDDILVTVIIGHAVIDGKNGPLVRIFATDGRGSSLTEARLRFDCTGPSNGGGKIVPVTVKASYPKTTTEHQDWQEALSYIAGSIAELGGSTER